MMTAADIRPGGGSKNDVYGPELTLLPPRPENRF